MNKLMLQYEHSGEKHEIWNTNAKTISDALLEMDTVPEENGHLYLGDSCNNELDVETSNGGF